LEAPNCNNRARIDSLLNGQRKTKHYEHGCNKIHYSNKKAYLDFVGERHRLHLLMMMMLTLFLKLIIIFIFILPKSNDAVPQ
jgi:hypothetical protein